MLVQILTTGVGAQSVTIYRGKILNDALLPWARKQFGRNHWTFHQDSAPSHKVRENQRFLQEKVHSFISSQQWPPYFPDLNPIDFSIWSILGAKVSTKKYHIKRSTPQRLLFAKYHQTTFVQRVKPFRTGSMLFSALTIYTSNNKTSLLKFEVFLQYTEVFK